MKEIKDGRITILFDHLGMTIAIIDNAAVVTFAKIKLDAKQACQALGRLAYTHCNIEVDNLEKVGKRREMKTIEFEVPDDYKNASKTAHKEALKHCPEGWTASTYFDSQDSFFYKENKKYARCQIVRWVEEEANETEIR